jgi:hypothetical protein
VTDSDENSTFGAVRLELNNDSSGMSNSFGQPINFKYFYGADKSQEKRSAYSRQLKKLVIDDGSK